MKISKKRPRRDVWTFGGVYSKKTLSFYRNCAHVGPKHSIKDRTSRSGHKLNKGYDWFSMVNHEEVIL